MHLPFFYNWHSRFGIIIAFFVIVLVMSGFALNHTEQLRLDDQYVQSEWLLNWYKIDIDRDPITFIVNNKTVTQLGQRLYLDTEEIKSEVTHLTGAVKLVDSLIISVDQELLLFDENDKAIEILASVDGVPSGMKRIGIDTDGLLVLDAAHGFYHVDLEEMKWREADKVKAQWSESTEPTQELLFKLKQLYRGKGLTSERVIQDIHSGRILGFWGVVIMDVIGFLLLLLAISGSYMWFKRTRNTELET